MKSRALIGGFNGRSKEAEYPRRKQQKLTNESSTIPRRKMFFRIHSSNKLMKMYITLKKALNKKGSASFWLHSERKQLLLFDEIPYSLQRQKTCDLINHTNTKPTVVKDLNFFIYTDHNWDRIKKLKKELAGLKWLEYFPTLDFFSSIPKWGVVLRLNNWLLWLHRQRNNNKKVKPWKVANL